MRVLAIIGALVLLSGVIAEGCCAATDQESVESRISIPYKDPRPDVFMTDWLTCGPFTIEDPNEAPEEAEPTKKSFTHDFLTEHGGEAKIEPTPGMTHHQRGEEYVWQQVSGTKDFISFVDLYGLKQRAIAYAWAEIEMSAPASAVLGIGSDDGVKVWLNGEVIHENWTFRSFAVDQDQVSVHLRQGKNRLLIKVQNGLNPPWGFACRPMSAKSVNRTYIVAAGQWWDPDSSPIRVLLDRMEADLVTGPTQITSHWPLEAFIKPSYRESAFRKLSSSLPPALRHRLGIAGQRLAGLAKGLPTASQSDAQTVAAWFYAATGQMHQAMAACDAALRLPGDHESAAFLLADLRYQASGKRRRPPIDEYLKWEMARQHIPGLSVALVRDGKVVLAKGYGLANVELSAPATQDTVYRLGSLSKPFTTSAVMLLVEEGKIALEDPILKYRPDWPPAWSEIRVRHLLTHTAGLQDYLNELPTPPGGYSRETPPGNFVQMVAGLPLKFLPGEQWSYDNTAFVLLRLIIEKVSGRSYGEFMAERIFQPLGMTATRVYSFRDIIKNRAGHYTWEGNTLRNVNDYDPTWGTSGAELASTVADLVKFDAALYTEKLLKQSTLEQMWTPAKLNNGQTVDGAGMGWFIGNYRGHKTMGHEGSSLGSACALRRFPEAKCAVILLTHFYNVSVSDMTTRIADFCLPAAKPIEDRDPKTTQRLKQVLLRLAAGEADPAQFTPQAPAALSSEIRQASAFYQSLGPLKSLYLIERTSEEKKRTYRYRTVFRDTAWLHRFVLTEDGKIAELGVEPE